MMKSICQSCNGRNACATARSSARIIRGFIWGKLLILSALRSSSLSALSGPFHDGILLKRSRFHIPNRIAHVTHNQQTLSTKRRPKLTSVTVGVSSGKSLPPRSMANISLRSLLTPAVFIPIANYAIFASLEISRRALVPLFFSTPT